MTDLNGKNKDERAFDALLAAAFRLDFPKEISKEEAEAFFQKPVQLSCEDKAAVNSWSNNFIKTLIKTHKITLDVYQYEDDIDKTLESQITAMARDKSGNDVSDEKTQKIIEEERQKALDEEDKRNKEKNDESNS